MFRGFYLQICLESIKFSKHLGEEMRAQRMPPTIFHSEIGVPSGTTERGTGLDRHCSVGKVF
jgi:hypothetical protein